MSRSDLFFRYVDATGIPNRWWSYSDVTTVHGANVALNEAEYIDRVRARMAEPRPRSTLWDKVKRWFR